MPLAVAGHACWRAGDYRRDIAAAASLEELLKILPRQGPRLSIICFEVDYAFMPQLCCHTLRHLVTPILRLLLAAMMFIALPCHIRHAARH